MIIDDSNNYDDDDNYNDRDDVKIRRKKMMISDDG